MFVVGHGARASIRTTRAKPRAPAAAVNARLLQTGTNEASSLPVAIIAKAGHLAHAHAYAADEQ
eukprot:COSAG06_NODE_4787_length_3954_cov_12.519585_1_plen_64_part_00